MDHVSVFPILPPTFSFIYGDSNYVGSNILIGSSKEVDTSVVRDIPIISTATQREEQNKQQQQQQHPPSCRGQVILLTFVLKFMFFHEFFIGQYCSCCSVRGWTTLQLLQQVVDNETKHLTVIVWATSRSCF